MMCMGFMITFFTIIEIDLIFNHLSLISDKKYFISIAMVKNEK